MLKVLIVSRNEIDNNLIERKLAHVTRRVGRVSFSSARPASMATVLDTGFNLIVYNDQQYTSSIRNNVQSWRSLGYFGPVIVMVKMPDPKVFDRMADLHNVTILEKPYDNKDLLGIAEKYLSDSRVMQRKFRRFDTQQRAQLEAYNKDFTSSSIISNISKGGVHITGDLEDISKGDLLRVCFELDELKKNHTMAAQVVWTRGEVGTAERSAGLKFVSKAEVYKSLLDGA